MRLICPNCGAQYEVPDQVIPTSGRDVQCSNCGDTWFQHHPDHEPEPEDEPEQQTSDDLTWQEPADNSDEDEPVSEDDAESEPDSDFEPDSDPEPDFEPEPEPEPENTDEPTPQRQQLDPAIADVLREEAEREQEARNAEAQGGLETQPDLGLEDQSDSADERSRQARARMARLRGQSETEVIVATGVAGAAGAGDDIDIGSRRNLLPDIEEINSSLNSGQNRNSSAQSSAEADAEEMNGGTSGGFRRGFMIAVVLVLIMLLLYKFAPVIAAKVPATEGVLASYVEAINNLRTLINDKVAGFLGPQN